MAEPERLGWIFLKAVLSHTIQTVGGSLFAAATAVWGLGAWMRPTLKPPGYQPWMLGAIAAGFYGFGAFKAWVDERKAKETAHAQLISAQATKPDPVITLARHSSLSSESAIFIDVTNNGVLAEFWATLTADGNGLKRSLHGHAKWDKTMAIRQQIPKGTTFGFLIAWSSEEIATNDHPAQCHWRVLAIEDYSGKTISADSRPWQIVASETQPEPQSEFLIDLVVMSNPDSVKGAVSKQIRVCGNTITDETGKSV